MLWVRRTEFSDPTFRLIGVRYAESVSAAGQAANAAAGRFGGRSLAETLTLSNSSTLETSSRWMCELAQPTSAVVDPDGPAVSASVVSHVGRRQDLPMRAVSHMANPERTRSERRGSDEMRDATIQDEPCVRAHAGMVVRDDPAEAGGSEYRLGVRCRTPGRAVSRPRDRLSRGVPWCRWRRWSRGSGVWAIPRSRAGPSRWC